MLFSASQLHDFASQQLGCLAKSACLPIELLDKYTSLYPEGLFCVSSESGLHGFLLLVPVTDRQAASLLSGAIKSGFELSASQVTQKPQHFWKGVTAYYLMGIYADEQGRHLIKNKFDSVLSSFQSSVKIFAKGTTERGKSWMKKRGFEKVNSDESPISVLFVQRETAQ